MRCENERCNVPVQGKRFCSKPCGTAVWKRANRLRVNASARAWKWAHKEHVVAYDAAYDKEHRGTCPSCGGDMSRGSDECFGCIKERSAQRAECIIELWAEGKKTREIAVDLGITPGAVHQEIHRLRAQGRDLPYRRAS